MMLRNVLFWILALAITLTAAVYQRLTGPTYPARGEVSIGGISYNYRLLRSHGGQTDAPIEIRILDPEVRGALVWKRLKTLDEWTESAMQRDGELLRATLPNQPPAGKLEYYIRLTRHDDMITVPKDQDLVIRFKGAVPDVVMIPHILLMFAAMLVSTRAALEALSKRGKIRNYALWAAGLLFLGGMIMGPVVQKYAFGALWTGVPFGWDLTDNKTLIAMIGWAIAVYATSRGKLARFCVIFAAVLLLAIFSIPHSLGGSELNYETGKIGTAEVGR
jgi:hypothetical protein